MLKEFKKTLEEYKISVGRANSEATKAYSFLEFIRDTFKNAKLSAGTPKELELEKFITSNKTVLIKGRMDARLGNLIIEFETDISSYQNAKLMRLLPNLGSIPRSYGTTREEYLV